MLKNILFFSHYHKRQALEKTNFLSFAKSKAVWGFLGSIFIHQLKGEEQSGLTDLAKIQSLALNYVPIVASFLE